jgi:hypothetical protein
MICEETASKCLPYASTAPDIVQISVCLNSRFPSPLSPPQLMCLQQLFVAALFAAQRAPVPSQQPRFSLVVCQLTGLKKSSDRNVNCSCISRAHHFHNITVHHKESYAAGPLVQKACCSMESLTCHFQDVIVFGCLGWQIKVTLEPPSRRFGNEKALSAPH